MKPRSFLHITSTHLLIPASNRLKVFAETYLGDTINTPLPLVFGVFVSSKLEFEDFACSYLIFLWDIITLVFKTVL